tara:strand:- start:494 stop:790 length:297 start_codon:yes stop_codon:yes gene_type:complete
MHDYLTHLQQWYAAQSDGEWEHSHGISISTLDNPGWHLTIDLDGTKLARRGFQKLRHQGENPVDWYVCEVKEQVFDAAGGVENLQDMLKVFIEWANRK